VNSDSDSMKRMSLIESSNSSSINQAVVICWNAIARYSSWTASTRSIITRCYCWLSLKSLLWTSSSSLNSASWKLKKQQTMCEFWNSWSFCILSLIYLTQQWFWLTASEIWSMLCKVFFMKVYICCIFDCNGCPFNNTRYIQRPNSNHYY